MTTREFALLAMLILAQATPALAQSTTEPRPVNAYGRGSLCLPGTVETKLGCVQETSAEGAARMASVHDCMVSPITAPVQRSIYRQSRQVVRH